jgi:hypothetical protein
MITRRLCHRPCIGSLPMAMQPFSSVLIPPDQRGRQSAQIGQRALLRAALLAAEALAQQTGRGARSDSARSR